MKFYYNDRLVQLQRDTSSKVDSITFHQFTKLQHKKEIVSYLQIREVAEKTDSPTKEFNHLPERIQQVLSQYQELFQVPASLPPKRDIDHQIHLPPRTQPVKVKNYRYPHFQKSEIKKLIKEMLDTGIIRESNSPFSSPALSIKKKMTRGDFMLTTEL